jgi:cellulose biosynthesis protein BcsQ
VRPAVCSSKGGVGKTATAADLAVVLAGRGRTLAVDADPQDSPGRASGVVAKGREDSLAGVLQDASLDPRGAVRRDVVPGLDLLPAHPSLEHVGVALAAQGGITSSVRRALRPSRIPLSRRVPSSTLAKRPVVLSAPTSPVAQACTALADDVLAAYAREVRP